MQFNRQRWHIFEKLPAPSVDTGMGLERIGAIMQGVHSNYEIDIFTIMQHAAQVINLPNDIDLQSEPSLKVLTISMFPFNCDGVLPSNEGRGYVLRRIIRRAFVVGNKLGANDNFFYKLVAPLAQIMGDAYPQLREQQANIEQTILKEEEQFAKTLSKVSIIQELDKLKIWRYFIRCNGV